MRCRSDIEKDIESISRDNDGDLHYSCADNDEVQVLILEVLLDIRKILSMGW
jgi:hypothetical protein